jgi:hypothetical protein
VPIFTGQKKEILSTFGKGVDENKRLL